MPSHCLGREYPLEHNIKIKHYFEDFPVRNEISTVRGRDCANASGRPKNQHAQPGFSIGGLTVQNVAHSRKNDRRPKKVFNLPMNKHTPTSVKTLLYEDIGGGEMLEHVLIIHVIHLDYVMLEVDEQVVIKRQSQS